MRRQWERAQAAVYSYKWTASWVASCITVTAVVVAARGGR